MATKKKTSQPISATDVRNGRTTKNSPIKSRGVENGKTFYTGAEKVNGARKKLAEGAGVTPRKEKKQRDMTSDNDPYMRNIEDTYAKNGDGTYKNVVKQQKRRSRADDNGRAEAREKMASKKSKR